MKPVTIPRHRGLERCTIDRWVAEGKPTGFEGKERFICQYSVRWENVPPEWPTGPEFRCRYVVGHNGEHKWYDSDEHGDYDMWMPNSKYDYQLEEI